MRKPGKKVLSLALALVMCLALMPTAALAKEAQAGDTTVEDSSGIGFDLSKPLLGTKILEFYAENGDKFLVPIYVIPEGTIVVPKMEGSLPVETGQKLAVSMGDTNEEIGNEFELNLELYDWSGQGGNLEIDKAGITFSPEKTPGLESYSNDGFYLIECRLWISYPDPVYDPSSPVQGNGGSVSGWVRVFVGFEVAENDTPVTPEQPATPSTLPTVEDIPATGTAVARTQSVLLDGKTVSFQYYAVKNAQGNETNYVKVRDLAQALNGTAAQFNVGWDGKISITSNTAYEAVGGEGSTPYSGDQPYTAVSDTPVRFNGSDVNLTSFQLKDDAGSGYTYFKLRDLGQLLNFNVTWNGSSIVVESDKPYTG